MGIVAQEAWRVWKRDFPHHLRDPSSSLVGVLSVVMGFQNFTHLGADAQCRVQRRGRILWHIADHSATELLLLRSIQLEHVDVANSHRAALDDSPPPAMT